MAANNFATVLHRNTNKVIAVLVYAFLEWILIILLLLNSIFTYLITRFANYFGLNPPCPWCSRLDHFLDETSNSYTNLLCSSHATLISRLGYCTNHARLAETNSMCIHCLAPPPDQGQESTGIKSRIAVISWVSMEEDPHDDDRPTCSCCNQRLTRMLPAAAGGEEEDPDENEDQKATISPNISDQTVSVNERTCLGEDESLVSFNFLYGRHVDSGFDRLVPVELIDSLTSSINLNHHGQENQDQKNESLGSFSHSNVEGKSALVLENNQDNSYILAKDDDANDESIGGEIQVRKIEEEEVDDVPEKEIYDLKADQTKSKATSKLQEQGSTPLINLQEDRSSTTGPNHSEEEENTLADKKHHVSTRSWSNEAEEEKIPETPTSVHSIHNLHKELLPFEKRESGAEESIDGSVVSEMESGDPVSTVDRLKTALISERKALTALYSELEEERSASAIAANQTMAMINRIQEEKAAMQMETLQYQRMMEEQAEYDQEALQLLNELMIKREKEKQEVEKELEVYRKKVLEYEAKERMKMMRTRSKNGSLRSRNSSTSFSNTGDIDELSIDLNREARDEDSSMYGNNESSCINTPGEEVINLEEIALDCVKQISALDNSLEEFEEERHCILDQLKALEEKLLSLRDNEVMTEDSTSKGLLFHDDYEFSTGVGEGNDDPNERFPKRGTMDSMAKTLLPLLDGAEDETEEATKIEENAYSELLDAKKVAVEAEVDHVYERLQALEADGKFLKHCMSSIQKGDKGMDLLQDILQHLRDVRAAELCLRSTNEDPME